MKFRKYGTRCMALLMSLMLAAESLPVMATDSAENGEATEAYEESSVTEPEETEDEQENGKLILTENGSESTVPDEAVTEEEVAPDVSEPDGASPTGAAGSFAGGSGTEDDPYLVADYSQLLLIGQMTDEEQYGSYYKLTADITANNSAPSKSSVNVWTPVEPNGLILDGAGYTKKNLCLGADMRGSAMLFNGNTSAQEVKNLNIQNVYFKGDYSAIAAIGSEVDKLLNCTLKGTVTSGSKPDWLRAGLLVLSSSDIDSCVYDASFSSSAGSAALGGIVLNAKGNVTNCSTTENASIKLNCEFSQVAGILNACVDQEEETLIEGNVNRAVITIASGDEGSVSGIATDLRAGGVVFKENVNYGTITGGSYATGIVNEINTAVSGCRNYGEITGTQNVAGICIHFKGDSISDCVNYGRIKPDFSAKDIKVMASGIVCGVQGNAVITNCRNEGTVQSGAMASGILGSNASDILTVEKCSNTGNIEALYAAGIAYCPSNAAFDSCYNAGTIKLKYYEGLGNLDTGGLIGVAESCTIRNCFNSGLIDASKGKFKAKMEYVGGLVGRLESYAGSTAVIDCYNVGSIKTGGAYSYGLAGISAYYHSDVSITNCYYLEQKGLTDGVGDENKESYGISATKLTAAGMIKQESFIAWDFESTWQLGRNASYPYPELIANPYNGNKVDSSTSEEAEVVDTAGSVLGIFLSDTTRTLYEGESFTLSATVNAKDGVSTSVNWNEDNGCATVNADGKVNANSKGVTIITASSEADPNFSASCTVYVKKSEILAEDEAEAAKNKTPVETNRIWFAGLASAYPYTGQAIKPELRVYQGRKLLTAGVDYTLGYSANTKKGTEAKVSIKAKGNINNSVAAGSFEIRSTDLKTEVSAAPIYVTYSGKANKPKPVLMLGDTKLKLGGKDVTYSYYTKESASTGSPVSSDCKEAGEYVIRVSANSDNFTNHIDVPLTVSSEKTALSSFKPKADKSSLKYTGAELSPVWTLGTKKFTLSADTDYMISGTTSAKDPGTYTVTFTAKDGSDYVGSVSASWKITGKKALNTKRDNADLCEVSIDEYSLTTTYDGVEAVAYNAAGAKPAVQVSFDGVTLTQGVDYTIAYKGNKLLGKDKASVIVKGRGVYSGSYTKYFTVGKCDISSLNLFISDRLASKKSGDYKKTTFTFLDDNGVDQKLKLDKDFTMDYGKLSTDLPAAGSTLSVTITATENSNYSGSVKGTYRIISKAQDLSRAGVKINAGKGYTYTGSVITPAAADISVTLDKKPVSDYDVLGCFNNVNKGSATLILRGKGDYAGVKLVKFKISAQAIGNLL